jgi:hypothetical protein
LSSIQVNSMTVSKLMDGIICNSSQVIRRMSKRKSAEVYRSPLVPLS